MLAANYGLVLNDNIDLVFEMKLQEIRCCNVCLCVTLRCKLCYRLVICNVTDKGAFANDVIILGGGGLENLMQDEGGVGGV